MSDDTQNDQILDKPSWKIRRRLVNITLTFIAINVLYIVFRADAASMLHLQIGLALITAGVSIIGAYIFGATWDDKNYMHTIANSSYNPPPSKFGPGGGAPPPPPMPPKIIPRDPNRRAVTDTDVSSGSGVIPPNQEGN